MGIETLQKAALAAGFAMATPDDDPPVDDSYAERSREVWEPASGKQLVPLSHAHPQRTGGARDSMAAAAAWIRDHLPVVGGGRAPA